jgi:hypothetical protein
LTLNYIGNFGIGTDSPTAKLHVEKDSVSEPLGLFKTTAGDASVRIEGAGGESYLEIANTSAGTGSTTNSWGIGMNDNTSLSFGWGANNTLNKSTYLTILDGGNVGIGTTSPGSYKLNVAGTMNVEASASAAWLSVINNSAINGHGLYIQAGGTTGTRYITQWKDYAGTERFHMEDNGEAYFQGNVGIGTTGPIQKLEVAGTVKAAAVRVYDGLTGTGIGAAADYGALRLYASSTIRALLQTTQNTAYTPDGIWGGSATPSYYSGASQAKILLGYQDNGAGLYSGAYGFMVKTTDGRPVTDNERGAIYIRDESNNRMPLIITNKGRISLNPLNTGYDGYSRNGWISIDQNNEYGISNYYHGTDAGKGCAYYRLDNTGPSYFDFFYSTTQVGSITQNGTNTAYNVSSDYRLKKDLQDFAGLDMVSKIPVYDFKWKTDESRSYGVMAHELQEVLPQAVTGEKDAEKMQQVDYSKIVPLLVKSIQELKAEIEILKNK